MTDFVSTWNKDSFLTYPIGPLGLIAMPGTEEMGVKVNSWLKKWQDHTEESLPGDMSTTPGAERQDFLIEVNCAVTTCTFSVTPVPTMCSIRCSGRQFP